MATIKGYRGYNDAVVNISLGDTPGSFSVDKEPMPRADDCHRCAFPLREHVDGKCLFDSCVSVPISREEFDKRFTAWVDGRTIEDALTNIAFAATGGIE